MHVVIPESSAAEWINPLCPYSTERYFPTSNICKIICFIVQPFPASYVQWDPWSLRSPVHVRPFLAAERYSEGKLISSGWIASKPFTQQFFLQCNAKPTRAIFSFLGMWSMAGVGLGCLVGLRVRSERKGDVCVQLAWTKRPLSGLALKNTKGLSLKGRKC